MSVHDRLPPELRIWLAGAALPWSATSALRIWHRALRESGCPKAALDRLHRARQRRSRAMRLWSGVQPTPVQGDDTRAGNVLRLCLRTTAGVGCVPTHHQHHHPAQTPEFPDDAAIPTHQGGLAPNPKSPLLPMPVPSGSHWPSGRSAGPHPSFHHNLPNPLRTGNPLREPAPPLPG
ncbi:DUF6525 family protein [Tabrizicola sp.]|uniref:DUF6525 family protein n=1 Tax=Tabrizicola sp. TaxID=2005166 RepID=UPI0025DCF365|nr:DUF6525 family protein [Tabrizicola sp.]